MSTGMGINYESADKASQDAWDTFSQSMSVFLKTQEKRFPRWRKMPLRRSGFDVDKTQRKDVIKRVADELKNFSINVVE